MKTELNGLIAALGEAGVTYRIVRPWRDIAMDTLFGSLRPLLTGLVARYVSSSVVALCADTGSFLVFLQLGMAPAPAAALGFMIGIAVHWLVSSRVMFAADIAAAGPDRRRQQAMFVAAALVGLVLTTAIVGGAAALACNPRLAKLVAVGVSFVTTSALRHLFVFRQPGAVHITA